MIEYSFTLHSTKRGDIPSEETFRSLKDARNCAWEHFNADTSITEVTFRDTTGWERTWMVVISKPVTA